MSTENILRSAIDFLLVLAVAYGILNEKAVIRFERKIIKRLRAAIFGGSNMKCMVKMPGRDVQIRCGVHNDKKSILREIDCENAGALTLDKDVLMIYDADGFAKQLPSTMTDEWCEVVYFGDIIFIDKNLRSLNAKQEKYIENYVKAHSFD